jgi:glutamate 5-kinase
VTCIDSSGKEIARGLVNYSASDTKKIIRKPTDQIESVLGFQIEPELIHRNNMVLMLA